MTDLSGINHVTFLTADLDRLAAFYEEVFGARKLVELPIAEPQGPGRHALIGIGGRAALHPFEFTGTDLPPPGQMFERGRIDHFALDVPDGDTFDRIRDDLIERGATNGTVIDFGVLRVLSFSDPDGRDVELAHWVGGPPEELDMASASDEELAARRSSA